MGLAGQLKQDWAARPWHFTAWRNSNDPKFVFNLEDLKIHDANPAAEALLNAPPGGLEGQPVSSLLDAPYMVRLREALAEDRLDTLGGGNSLLSVDPDCSLVFTVSLDPVGSDGLCFCRLSRGSLAETDRDLRRLNWALAAYARSSTALIRSTDFEELVTGVCEAIVGEDDYLAATVRLVEHGPGLPVRYVAGAGRAAAYIQTLNLSWSDEFPTGRGPTGIAVRTNRPFLMKDSHTEPALSFRRREAIELGIRSSVTVPFGKDGEPPAGVIIVYADQADAFGERELDVFSRLGRELAFAQAVEEDRAQLREAEEARRAAEEAAQESLAELARAARVISVATFASSIAHEVNQPVAAIVANSEAALRWLDRATPNIDEARAALARITRDAERTSAVVGRTRGMLTKDLGHREAVQVQPLIEEALLFIEPQRKRAGVRVETDFAAGLPQVWADPVQVQQVLVNLIANAIDAMKNVPGRRRLLKVCTALNADGEVLVSVSDTGPGVEADNLQHIFTQLFTTKPDGMGLGLSISKAIVEAHGGRLEMAGNEPQGAVFSFTLPAQESC